MEPVRILQVVTKMDCGGLETMIMNYYRKIDRNRIQFDFLTHRQEPGMYDEEIQSLGGQIYYGMPISLSNMFSYLKWLDDFFNKHTEYKIVHSHIDALSAYVLFAAKQRNVKVRIAHSHNVDFDKDIKYVFRIMSKSLILPTATNIWGCSEAAIDFMFGKKARQKTPWTVMKNAIDIDKFQYNQQTRDYYRKQLNLEDVFVIGHVGRFCYQKNQELLIEILRKMPVTGKKTVLALLGKGENLEKLKDLIKSYGLEEQVIFLGEKKNVEDYLQMMDVFCFPSRFEGLGIALLEAQAAGLPCVVSDAVPDEAILVPAVHKIKGFAYVDSWIKGIQESVKEPRDVDIKEYFVKGRYDINVEVPWLETTYLELLQNSMGNNHGN